MASVSKSSHLDILIKILLNEKIEYAIKLYQNALRSQFIFYYLDKQFVTDLNIINT